MHSFVHVHFLYGAKKSFERLQRRLSPAGMWFRGLNPSVPQKHRPTSSLLHKPHNIHSIFLTFCILLFLCHGFLSCSVSSSSLFSLLISSLCVKSLSHQLSIWFKGSKWDAVGADIVNNIISLLLLLSVHI